MRVRSLIAIGSVALVGVAVAGYGMADGFTHWGERTSARLSVAQPAAAPAAAGSVPSPGDQRYTRSRAMVVGRHRLTHLPKGMRPQDTSSSTYRYHGHVVKTWTTVAGSVTSVSGLSADTVAGDPPVDGVGPDDPPTVTVTETDMDSADAASFVAEIVQPGADEVSVQGRQAYLIRVDDHWSSVVWQDSTGVVQVSAESISDDALLAIADGTVTE